MAQITNHTSEINNTVANLPIASVAHEVHAEGSLTIEQAIEYLCDLLGVEMNDMSLRGRALREYIGCIINTWDPDDWENMNEYEEYYRSCVMDAMENYGAACYDLWDSFGTHEYAPFIIEYYKLYGDEAQASRYEKYLAA